METFLFFLAFSLSWLQPNESAVHVDTSPTGEALEVIWGSMYPELGATLVPRTPVPEPSSAQISGSALYATNRALWTNFLAAEIAAQTNSPSRMDPVKNNSRAQEEKRSYDELLLLLERRISERLSYSALAVARKASTSGILSPSERDLVSALMDLSDLGFYIQAPLPKQTPSPVLAAVLGLYEAGAGQRHWDHFAARVLEARFYDAVHLIPRVPRQFLAQAYNLLDHLPLSGDISEVEKRSDSRSLILLRLKIAGQQTPGH